MKAQWLLVALALSQYDAAQERRRTTGLAAYYAVIAALQLIWGVLPLWPQRLPALHRTQGPQAQQRPPHLPRLALRQRPWEERLRGTASGHALPPQVKRNGEWVRPTAMSKDEKSYPRTSAAAIEMRREHMPR